MEEVSPTSCELSRAATAWRGTVAIHFRFNGARATEYRPCGVGICKGLFSIRPIFGTRSDGVCRAVSK